MESIKSGCLCELGVENGNLNWLWEKLSSETKRKLVLSQRNGDTNKSLKFQNVPKSAMNLVF